MFAIMSSDGISFLLSFLFSNCLSPHRYMTFANIMRLMEFVPPEFPACPPISQESASLPSQQPRRSHSVLGISSSPVSPEPSSGSLPIHSSFMSPFPPLLTSLFLTPIKPVLLKGSISSQLDICVISHQVMPSKTRCPLSLKGNFKKGPNNLC